MRYSKAAAILLWWCIAGQLCLAAAQSGSHTREEALRFLSVANTVLKPVYGPLAEQIVHEYNLAEREGIGIDLGSGPGHLIVELCKRTRRVQWINADINPHFFPFFLKAAQEAGVKHRVRAIFADAQALPFEDNYAEIIVSRGSFHLWENKRLAFSEIYRVLKPGGVAFIGRGFSENLPVDIARNIRSRQGENGRGPQYNIARTAAELQEIMHVLEINDYHIIIPEPPGSEGVNYGIWLEFHKPTAQEHRLNNSETEGAENSYIENRMYVKASDTITAGSTGKIQGTIVDSESKEPLPSVNVVIERTTLGAATDEEGYFLITDVPPETYSLKASMVGYAPETKEKVRVFVGRTTTADFSLLTSAIAGEEVMVRAMRLRSVIEEPMLESPGLELSITVVNKSEIRKQGAKNIIDALEYVPSALVESFDGLAANAAGFQNWLEIDKDVLGGNYRGHYPGSPEKTAIDEQGSRYPEGEVTGPTLKVKINPDAKDHPVLDGITDFRSRYSLYRTSPVAPDVEVLMTGTIPTGESEPLAWTRKYKGARVVYIAIGGLQDWENSTFKRLVTNALFWAGKRNIPPEVPATVKQRPQPKGKIMLSARSRVEREKGSDQWEETTVAEELFIGETAIIICDMWDKHWCTGATKRVDELARKMAPVVNKAREKGIQIIHAPSSTMPFYAGWPQRQRMVLAPEVPKPEPLALPDHPLPIDDSDGGCDTDDESYSAWARQSPHIEIGEYDGISDDGNEIYNFFNEQGIKRIIMMGVHTNMCVLNRSFAIKQMRRWGIDCLLVRDLTDAMYDPKDAPYVSHDEGTELVVQHIEKYWCPSILSKDLVAALDKL